MTNKPIVVEFIASDYPEKDAKHYFIGASLEAILRDTNQGKEFGCFAKFSSYRVILLGEAKKLGLGYYEKGYMAVTTGLCKSYKLDTPRGNK